MDEIEPLRRISTDEPTPTIEATRAAGDFRSANKRGRADLGEGKRSGPKRTVTPDDVVILSDVAQVSLLEEDGMGVAEIATDLGLTAAAVLTDLAIAAKICHRRMDSKA